MFSMQNEQSIWKKGIFKKQGRNVSKGEYGRVIRTLLPGLSGGLLHSKGKLTKMLSFLCSLFSVGFLTTKFLPLASNFSTEINLLVKTFPRTESQFQGRISGLEQKEPFIITLCYRQARVASDLQMV